MFFRHNEGVYNFESSGIGRDLTSFDELLVHRAEVGFGSMLIVATWRCSMSKIHRWQMTSGKAMENHRKTIGKWWFHGIYSLVMTVT